MPLLGGLNRAYDRWVWAPDTETLSRRRRIPILSARIIATLVDDFRDGEITMRAMGLVYTTLVSLVPLLALAFSLLKAFGVNNALRPTLQRFLAPLGGGSTQIIDKIVDFVANVQVGVLGAIGVVTLIYSVLSLIQKVEAGCNFIWRVRQPRSIGRRVTEYLSVLVAGPLVILAAASLTASLSNNSVVSHLSQMEGSGAVLYVIGRLLPYVLYSIGFTLLFKFIPNTFVKVGPAIGGGIFAGVLWQTASLGFALFASNAGNVNAIYSSFAILILLLIWLYVSWMIMLLGCRVAFLLQYPERLTRGSYPPRLGAAGAERLTLLVAGEIARRFLTGEPPANEDALAQALRATPDHVHAAVKRLLEADLLVETATEHHAAAVVPRRDIDTVRVAEILAIARRGEDAASPRPRTELELGGVDTMLERAERARFDAIGDLTLRELVTDTTTIADASPAKDVEPAAPRLAPGG